MTDICTTFYGFLLEHPNRWYVIRGNNAGQIEKVSFGTREQVISEAWERNLELVLRHRFAKYGFMSAMKRKRNRTMTTEQARATVAARWLKANPTYCLPPLRDRPNSSQTAGDG